MIQKDAVAWISKKLEVKSPLLIEKDLYLQGMLLGLSQSDYFSKNFAFKGGTCLTKAYFGYYRFSEDLDFTWINQDALAAKSQKQARKKLANELDRLIEVVDSAAKTVGLCFEPKKTDKRYIQLGGSNRFATFCLWYKPIDSEQETFMKIQVNFVEMISHRPKKLKLKAIAGKHKKEIEFLFPEISHMAAKDAELLCYDLQEIAAEKIRALLTRRGFKSRDIVDLYMLSKKGITIKSAKKIATEKTKFMLRYLKYGENLKNKKFDGAFRIGDEQRLVIMNLDKGFESFAAKTLRELNELAEEIRRSLA
jgi:predicted nucleotidyltransferase component of viral defense system